MLTAIRNLEAYLRNNVTVEWQVKFSARFRMSFASWRKSLRQALPPRSDWLRMQRHVNGGANVRAAIDAFVAMSGNIGVEGGGARYGHLHTRFNAITPCCRSRRWALLAYRERRATTSEFAGRRCQRRRAVPDSPSNINQTAQGISANDPPVRMLQNPLFARDFDRSKMKKRLKTGNGGSRRSFFQRNGATR